jgi:hypothetical protein
MHLKELKKRFWETPLYWLRTHTIHRYHMIDIRSPGNGYAWGWIDRSDAFLYANFAILVDFVEKEYPGLVKWDYDLDIESKRDEFIALYIWWTKERRREHDHVSSLPDVERLPAVEALDRKDDEMLGRLIKVRHYLWT